MNIKQQTLNTADKKHNYKHIQLLNDSYLRLHLDLLVGKFGIDWLISFIIKKLGIEIWVKLAIHDQDKFHIENGS